LEQYIGAHLLKHNYAIGHSKCWSTYALISKRGVSSENDSIGILKSHQAYADLRHFPSQQLVLNQLNYLVYDVPGDGNCFFSCEETPRFEIKAYE
jgi:hypothetical protein